MVTSRAPALLEIEYDGVVTDGRDDTESDAAADVRGVRETHRLSAVAGGTHLTVSAPLGEEYAVQPPAAAG